MRPRPSPWSSRLPRLSVRSDPPAARPAAAEALALVKLGEDPRGPRPPTGPAKRSKAIPGGSSDPTGDRPAAGRGPAAPSGCAHLIPTMLELQAAGRSLAQIAADLNDQGHKTRRDRRWSKTQVKRVLDRVETA
jgi:hypothetical protein